MLVQVRSWVGAGVGFLHNLWARGPFDNPSLIALWPAIQAAIVVIAFLAWQSLTGYGWTAPADLLDWGAWIKEFGNAAALTWAVLYIPVTQKLWPALTPYLLKALILMMQLPASATPGYKPTRVVVLWARAA
jgi:hypothetical protein